MEGKHLQSGVDVSTALYDAVLLSRISLPICDGQTATSVSGMLSLYFKYDPIVNFTSIFHYGSFSIFERLSGYCRIYARSIPLSFILGFYVGIVVDR